MLAPGGTLLVVDFAAHDREELRATDAHIRLGFEDEAMRGWFAAAGLRSTQIEHLKGGELTVTLWRGVKSGNPAEEGGMNAFEQLEPPSAAVRRGARRHPGQLRILPAQERDDGGDARGARSRPWRRSIRASSR